MTVPANVTRFLFEIIGESESLRVVNFEIKEAVSESFQIQLKIAAETDSADIASWVGKAGVITLFDTKHPRLFHGDLVAAKQLESGRRFTCYEVTLVSKFWFLNHRSGCRIFQSLSVPDIIEKVFTEANITNSDFRFVLNKSYQPREFCVQYHESEFHFLSRLMEEEGIFYFFEHHLDRHVMVICDDNAAFKSIENDKRVAYHPKTAMRPDKATIYQFETAHHVVPSHVMLGDFNFEKPQLTLRGNASEKQRHQLEHYQYPGQFATPSEGEDYADVSLTAQRVQKQLIKGVGDYQWLASGGIFELTDHERRDFNSDYVLLKVVHKGSQPQSLEEGASSEGSSYAVEFTGLPSKQAYKAPQTHTKQLIEGSQTAFVTGPKGEEIYTDEYGRIKIQFHWDREGQYDENTSCWVRVSQGWAGKEWGSIAIPRVGQEVIVNFLNGDPDRPIVTGRVYHAVNKTPYDLPGNKARSTFKSQSYPGGGGYNELRIDDKKGSEQIYVHAQKDVDVYVKNDYREAIDNDQHLTVQGNAFEDIGKDKNLTVGKNLNQKVGKSLSQTVGKDAQLKVSGSMKEQAGRDIHVKAGTQIVIQAGTQLTLKGGSGFIVLNPSGVTIQGPMVRINSGGSAGSAQGASPTAPTKPKLPEKGEAGQNLKPKSVGSPNKAKGVGFESGKAGKVELDDPGANPSQATNGSVTSQKHAQVSIQSLPGSSSLTAPTHGNNNAQKLGPSEQTTHYADLHFTYQDGSPVANGKYKLTDSLGNIHEGTLDSSGHAHVDGLPSGEVWVDFMDPDEAPVFKNDAQQNPEFQPAISAEELVAKSKGQQAGFWESNYNSLADAINDAGETLNDVKSWAWGVLQGDFNENPTTAQIITNAAITMIPIVDQVGDVRDLAANILKLTDDKEQNDTGAWIALVITLVCCVPVVGSALKGVFKYVTKKGGTVTKETLLAIVRALGKGDPERFLKHIDWGDITTTCQTHFKDIMDKSLEALDMLRQAMQRIANQAWLKKANELYGKLENLKAVGNQKIADAVSEIKDKVLKTLDDVPVVKRVRGSVDGKVSAKADEVGNILRLRHEELIEKGYRPKYTDEELRNMAASGKLPADRFVVPDTQNALSTLHTRGNNPLPGERSLTQAEYKELSSELRARVSLEGVGGHGHARHGAHTTLTQQETRIQTKIAPDGAKAPTPRATTFDSNQAELEAVRRAETVFNKNNAANPYPTTITTPKGKIKPNTVPIVVGGRKGGYGSGVEVIRDTNGKPLPGRPVQPTGQDPSAKVIFRYDPNTGQWGKVTQYPTN